MQNILLILPILLPLLGGLPVFRMDRRELRRGYITGVLLLNLLVVCFMPWQQQTLEVLHMTASLRLVLRADSVGRLFAVLVSAIWLLVAVYGDEYMTHEEKQPRFFGFYLVSLSSLMGICLAGNLVTLYLFYEMMTLLTVPLVMHTGTDESFDAGIKYLGFSVCGAAMSLLGLFYLQQYQTTDLFVAGGTLTNVWTEGLEVALLLLLVGFGAKAGMVPLFAWLPAAHPVAPSPASAVLSGLITKMGVLAILRVLFYQFGVDFVSGTWVQTLVMGLAIFTVFMGSMLALKEKTLKKRLAYSTVSQVSYILFGLLLLSPEGMTGALLQLVFHALAKNGLFLGAGCVVFYLHKTRTTDLRGAGKQIPWAMGCFAVFSLSLIGVPPLAGFVSKWYLAQGGLLQGTAGLIGMAVLMVSALLTAGYLLPIITDSFFVGADFDYKTTPKLKTSWRTQGPMVILAAALVVLGLFPGLLDGAMAPILAELFG